MNHWRESINNLISEEVGMLSEMIIDEALESMKISESEVTKKNTGRFLRALTDALPSEVNKKVMQKRIYEVLSKL